MKYENILESIGNTPHLRLKKFFPGAENVWVKLETEQPGWKYQGPHRPMPWWRMRKKGVS